MKVFVGVLAVFSLLNVVRGDTNDFLSMSIDELLSVKISTASINFTSLKEQPASVIVYNRKQIENAPVHSLKGILELIPGTSFGVDVFGVTSLNYRGHWAHEGKVLLLVDDMPVNDLLYGNLNLEQHYLTDQIERIEMIRGAGTAKYGGNAQLAVIKIYTRELAEGYEAHVSGLQIDDTGLGYQTIINGDFRQDDFSLSFSLMKSETPYSGGVWTDSDGISVKLDELTSLESWNAALKMDYKNLQFRLFHDYHDSENPHNFGFARDGESVSFESTNLSLSYLYQINDNWAFSPKIQYREQSDWFIDRDPRILPSIKDFFLEADKVSAFGELTYTNEIVDVLMGLEIWRSGAFALSPGGVTTDVDTYFNGSRSVNYDGKSLYVQSDLKLADWVLSGGLRYSMHSYADSSFVPRGTIGRLFDKGFLKFHFGRSYREPDIEVINSSNFDAPEIQSEITTYGELELGHHLSEHWFGTLSVFSNNIDDPIIYTSAGDESSYYYFNNDVSHTWGTELELRGAYSSSQLSFNYAYYRVEESPGEVYRMPSSQNLHNGIPQHKITVSGNWPIPMWEGARVSASWVSYFDTYTWIYSPTGNDLLGLSREPGKLENQHYLNVGFTYQREDWKFRIIIRDLGNEGAIYPQPYFSESTPYTGSGRLLRFSISKRW